MEKDLKSYKEHNKDYEGQFGIDSFREVKEKYKSENKFVLAGFKKAIDLFGQNKLHVDIGSGGGWLIFETSPLFENVVGIEPSKAACSNVLQLIKEYGYNNIKILNLDMIDAIKTMPLKFPTFFTTAIVLSHIKDSYVKQFLALMNSEKIPDGSALYFCERYDKNMHQRLWYIRRKYWWAKNLPNWQLDFFDIEDNGYKGGIYGVKIGKKNVYNDYRPSINEEILWFVDGIKQKILRIGRFLKRLLTIK